MHPHVLVIDEVGYLQCASDAANVLYGIVDQRCFKRRPIVFTTNEPLERWGEVLLERGQHLRLAGSSFTTRAVDPKTLDGDDA